MIKQLLIATLLLLSAPALAGDVGKRFPSEKKTLPDPVTGIPLTFLSPWLGITCAALVAVFWFLPESRLDRLFDGRAGHDQR